MKSSITSTSTSTSPVIYTAHDIGRMTGTDPTTVHKWIDRGMLRGYRTPGGHRRVCAAELRRFLAAHGMPVPEELGRISSLQVLLVDTEEDSWTKRHCSALRRQRPDWEIEVASNGLDGLLRVGGGAPGVLVLDLGMREVDGFFFARQLRTRLDTLQIKLIGLVGQVSAEIERKAEEAGIDQLLAKPISVMKLRAAIEAVVGQLSAA